MIDLVGDKQVRDQEKLVTKMHNRIGPLNDPKELLNKVNSYYWEALRENPNSLGKEQHVEVHIHKTIFLQDPIVREIRVKCLNTEDANSQLFKDEFIHTSLVCFFKKFKSKIVLYEVEEK